MKMTRQILNALSMFVFLSFASAPSQAYVKLGWDCLKSETKDECLRRGGLTGIYIFDEIITGDEERFQWIDKLFPEDKSFPKVYINSQGGRQKVAEAIARILRKRKSSIEGANPYAAYPSARCYSACVIIAAGAIDRQFNMIGVHRPHFLTKERDCKTKWNEVPEYRICDTMKIFAEMGLSEEFIELDLKTPSREMTELTYDPGLPDEQQDIVKFGFRMHKSKAKYEDVDGDNEKANLLAAVSMLEEIAEEGDAKAALALGETYFAGRRGVGRNIDDAIKWYDKAGALGDPAGYLQLGLIYSSSKFKDRNDRKAVSYYQKAADLGHAGAQNNLGWHYYEGEGIARDYGSALYWVTRSVDQGEPFAYGSLGEIFFRGHGIRKDDIQAYKWLTLASEQMPEGKSRDHNDKLLEKLKRRMTERDIEEAKKLAATWLPLKQTPSKLGQRCDR